MSKTLSTVLVIGWFIVFCLTLIVQKPAEWYMYAFMVFLLLLNAIEDIWVEKE